MCFAIRQNKPIIVFYNDLDKAKQTRLDGLSDRKLAYKEQLTRDEQEIRKLKRDIDDFKQRSEHEIQELADSLRSVKAEQQTNKDSVRDLNAFLKKEEDTILKKQ